jgi:hypothetical protein
MKQQERIRFKCPHCNVVVLAKNRVAGLTRQCPGCGGAVVVPLSVPDDAQPPCPDPDAVRGLHFLAVRAASVVQAALSTNPKSARLLNTIFVYLPREHELESISEQWDDQFDRAWQICSEVNSTIVKYGTHHRRVWLETFQSMQILDSSAKKSPERISRRKWSIAVRRAVWERFNRRCIHCGTTLETWQGNLMHLDHLIPLCEDGEDDESNLVPACPDCNLEKGRRRFPEIERIVKSSQDQPFDLCDGQKKGTGQQKGDGNE